MATVQFTFERDSAHVTLNSTCDLKYEREKTMLTEQLHLFM